ncbi:hypothetical protein [Metabacillus dongyingensis]|uniref:hypothetical protein n=1 Tax=Metabacillus dongyingensis TaxID=2874282 RepID=UPI001CBE9231|nr:hypothetical protein [Metabacillus dongyingensis]UAL53499.1 hypothetical protein K8L98_06855 [Metabacillus dongyingensis]
MVQEQLPNIDEMKAEDAILWYLKEINEVYSTKHRVAGTFSDDYKSALLAWKKELNLKCNVIRQQF